VENDDITLHTTAAPGSTSRQKDYEEEDLKETD
jgi:hypothetical protein